jgi:hypothetical protein
MSMHETIDEEKRRKQMEAENRYGNHERVTPRPTRPISQIQDADIIDIHDNSSPYVSRRDVRLFSGNDNGVHELNLFEDEMDPELR